MLEQLESMSGHFRRPSRTGGLVVAVLAVFLSACAGVPSQEMSDARRAVDSARDAGATQHTPLLMDAAARGLERAKDALRAGDYDTARALAVQARDQAIGARRLSQAVARAEEAIDLARREGRPEQGARALLDRALEAAQRGETARALDMAERAAALAR